MDNFSFEMGNEEEYDSLMSSSNHWCTESFEDHQENRGWGSGTRSINCVTTRGQKELPSSLFSIFRCSNAICQTCLDLNANFFPPGNLGYDKNTKSLHPRVGAAKLGIETRWDALDSSALRGCQFCSVLVEGIRGYLAAELPQSPARPDLSDPFRIEILIGHTVHVETYELRLEFYAPLGEPGLWSMVVYCG